mmetsp:Transcript_31495/g.57891  ORF Transcript_31495/g.57891 Transcript_31495/m.57891 type:complete len:382 (+) Transcript_31495:163-1308(+)
MEGLLVAKTESEGRSHKRQRALETVDVSDDELGMACDLEATHKDSPASAQGMYEADDRDTYSDLDGLPGHVPNEHPQHAGAPDHAPAEMPQPVGVPSALVPSGLAGNQHPSQVVSNTGAAQCFEISLGSNLEAALHGMAQLPSHLQNLTTQLEARLSVSEQSSKAALQTATSAATAAEQAATAAAAALKLAQEAQEAAGPPGGRPSPPRDSVAEGSVLVIGSWAPNTRSELILADVQNLLATLKEADASLVWHRFWCPYKRAALAHIRVPDYSMGERLREAVVTTQKAMPSGKPIWCAWRAPLEVRKFRGRCYQTGTVVEQVAAAQQVNIQVTVCTASGKIWGGDNDLLACVSRTKDQIAWQSAGLARYGLTVSQMEAAAV